MSAQTPDKDTKPSLESTDDFLSSYIAQAKIQVEKTQVRPDSTPSISLVTNDKEAPKDRKRFYTIKQMEDIADEECVDCEYKWRKCSIDPPTLYDRFLGCRKLRVEYLECKQRIKEELAQKSGKISISEE